MNKLLCVILSLLMILPPLPAQAWSEGGHHLIAAMAFRKLPKEQHVFPEGDRGANEIKTKQSRNLHALWDGLPGLKWDEADVDRRAREMPRVELAAGGIDDWLTESRQTAVASVYAPEVIDRCQWRSEARLRWLRSTCRKVT